MTKGSNIAKSFKFWLILVTIGIIGAIGWYVGMRKPSVEVEANSNTKIAEASINQTFSFDGQAATGKIAGKLKMVVDKVEVNSEVLIQGKPATVRGDKAFLVLNLEFENAETQTQYISPVDLIRLVGENDKKFAPDVHSEVIEVRPISVKLAKVGFVVQEGQKNFKIQIGSIEGQKQTIEFQVN